MYCLMRDPSFTPGHSVLKIFSLSTPSGKAALKALKSQDCKDRRTEVPDTFGVPSPRVNDPGSSSAAKTTLPRDQVCGKYFSLYGIE